jgi:hypothetical protein
MNSPACRFLVALALVLSLGLHWTALQSAAWLGMIVKYSQDASIEEALEKTFDGEHPCELCKLVEQGTKQQGQDEKKASDAIKKLDLLAMVPARFIPPPMPEPRPLPPLVTLIERADTPPLPPPIGV